MAGIRKSLNDVKFVHVINVRNEEKDRKINIIKSVITDNNDIICLSVNSKFSKIIIRCTDDRMKELRSLLDRPING